MRLLSVSTFVLAVVAAMAVAAQQSPMQPGRWQRTTQMQMTGMPMQMPPMTTTDCVTADQLKKDPNSFLPSGQNGNACKASDVKIVGSTVNWKMACTGQMAGTGEGEITFMSDSYAGTMKMSLSQGEMSMKLSAKRLGDCTQ